ncbi:MAG: LamG domain-containing protein, partial [Lewinella sp.]|nr:LamG domain-containing protein [Lewinella sp.]
MQPNSLFVGRVLACCLLVSTLGHAQATFCDNQALTFDGSSTAITLNLGGTTVNGVGPFTVEAQFWSNQTSGFHLLFSLSNSASPAILVIGLIPGGQLALFWENDQGVGTLQPVLIPTIPANLEQDCHHLAVTRQGNTLEVFLNGISVGALPTFTGSFTFSEFRVGGAQASIPGSLSWDGRIDEVRLWSTARPATAIAGGMDCVLSTPVPGLEVYWTFNVNPNSGQVTTPGVSNPGAVAIDESDPTFVNSNHGTLIGYGPGILDFVCNTCPSRYELILTDDPSAAPTQINTICSGEALHFGIVENFSPVQPIFGATVHWDYSDDNGQTWQPVPAAPPQFTGYAFGLPAGVLVHPSCASSPTGYLDRKYRARIVKQSATPPFACTYTTSEADLRICCPVGGTITLAPQPAFPPPVSTLCEGPATVQVTLNIPAWASALPIQWFIDGQYMQGFDNLTTFTYTGQANAPGLCFEAKIQHCVCPPETIKACLPVDPMPSCSLIDELFSNVTLVGPYDYVACPGDQATLGMTGGFLNCVPEWQYHFELPPGLPPDPWKPMGATNNWQNTNTIPNYLPPGVPLWPPNARCIVYRIECRPPNYPNSGCPNCTSNEVRICLEPDTLNPIVIAAQPDPFCETTSTTISITSPIDPAVTQLQWYCNGLALGPPQAPSPASTSITTFQPACYTVAVTDGCYTRLSNRVCPVMCDPVAAIHCPIDNPCACLEQPIMLDGGLLSYSNCG